MHSTTLQAMIAINANRITGIQADVADALSDAKAYKAAGEAAFTIASYHTASQHSRKLEKAVKLQNTMKTELSAIFRAARIAAKVILVAAKFNKETADGTDCVGRVMTSLEHEAWLDGVLSSLPKKPDSRLAK